jgi:hypothetical protein
MALISIDPFEFLATLKRDTRIFQWVSLIFQMALSSFVSFCGITGSALVAGAKPSVAIGGGLVSVALVLVTFFGSSSLTRGMMLVRPEVLAEQEIKTGMAVSTREFGDHK